MQLDQGCKTQKAQRLDFTTNENGFVKRINTIFSHGWPTNNGEKKKKTPSDYHWVPLGECTGGLGCPVHAPKLLNKKYTN
jgi:hypothetical protein